MLHRKEYKAIAEIIKSSKDKQEIADKLSSYFAQDNPLFIQSKFLTACGIGVELN